MMGWGHLNGRLPNLFPTNKHTIEMHGGKMKVESCENAGWVVNFKLPIDQENLSKVYSKK